MSLLARVLRLKGYGDGDVTAAAAAAILLLLHLLFQNAPSLLGIPSFPVLSSLSHEIDCAGQTLGNVVCVTRPVVWTLEESVRLMISSGVNDANAEDASRIFLWVHMESWKRAR